jgi:DUF1680 family protein
MSGKLGRPGVSRREMLGRSAQLAASTGLVPGVLQTAIVSAAMAQDAPQLKGLAGIDRVTVLTGKTYLRGWAGYGDPPQSNVPGGARRGATPKPAPTGPAPAVLWTKESGPGKAVFADPKALITSASFSVPGPYVLRLTADNGQSKAASTLTVLVETPPPPKQLDAVYTKNFRIDSPLWSARAKALMVNWIPHCIDEINRTDIEVGPGGIDNFVEAGKKLRGQPHGLHKGYVFSNAWIHQTVEAMSIALMIDAQGDREIMQAQQKMRATLDDWIPKILSAQEPDGYLQTAFTLSRSDRGKVTDTTNFKHWDPAHRGDHEGYVAGYFLEAAINHYLMTEKKDARLYNAAKKLADCWSDNLGPAPKKPWYDGHQQMEQGLVRFGRFVNDMEGGGKGQRYIELAKYLLDARYTTATNPRDQQEYDQSHLPVTQQYEAVGHAVRATYTYSGMADVAVETHDADYQSAVKSLWDNIVNRKYYVTGGIGSGETAEGFGPNYSLRNRAYNESCSTCGLIFFQWKLNLAYRDARFADLYEESMYNALLGSMDLEGRHFYYDNPLDERVARYKWHVCPCCVGNIPRTLLMLPTWTYAKSAEGVWVNMFVGSSITVEDVAGTDVEMVQRTDYPWNGKVSITVNPKSSKRFDVRIRVPNRTVSALYRHTPASGGISAVRVNGSPVKASVQNGYAVVSRTWKPGDRLDFELPIAPQRIHPSDKIESTRGKVALRYGPLIYNIESEDQDITKALAPGKALDTELRKDLLGGIVVIKGKFNDGTPMLAIPNFARMNRLPGLAYPPAPPPPGPDGRRPAPPPPVSIVWIKEG